MCVCVCVCRYSVHISCLGIIVFKTHSFTSVILIQRLSQDKKLLAEWYSIIEFVLYEVNIFLIVDNLTFVSKIAHNLIEGWAQWYVLVNVIYLVHDMKEVMNIHICSMYLFYLLLTLLPYAP